MLIKGLTMGTLDTQKKIDNFENDVSKKVSSLAKEFLKFQEESINLLKNYL